MSKNESYNNFKKDLEDIFSTILCLQYYAYTSEALYVNRNKVKLKTQEDLKIYESIHTFERRNFLNNSLFIALIALLESYLQDRLMEELESNEEKRNELVIKYSIDRKLSPEDVINGPRHLAREIIEGTIFHKLPKVNILYKIVFGVDILSLMKDKKIFTLISIRHKVVHHSSRVAGKRILLRDRGLLNAMNSISKWIESIEFYLNNKKERKTFPDYGRRYFKHMGTIDKSQIYQQARKDMMVRWLNNMDKAIKEKDNEKYLEWV